MFYQFKVSQGSKLLFKNTFAVADDDANPIVRLAHLADACFKRRCPGISLQDPDLSIEWSELTRSPLATALPAGGVDLPN
jgi:hypothetical protein